MEKNSFVKITEDLYDGAYEKDGPDGVRKMLADNINLHIMASSVDFEDLLLESLVDCESPIEQLLALEMENWGIQRMRFFNPFIEDVIVNKQYEIELPGKKYRVDFLIGVIYKKNKDNRNDVYYHSFVIECDGHEFHQKTKEQVEKDNVRNRELQKAGYEVMHFSGSEIYKCPRKSVMEIISLILSRCKYQEEKNER